MTTAANTPVVLVNVLSVKPETQRELLESLRHNTETVIMTLKGWIATNLIASTDGKRVVIYSHWETPADVDAMRSDPRMQAYFPKISELASFDSTVGSVVVAHQR